MTIILASATIQSEPMNTTIVTLEKTEDVYEIVVCEKRIQDSAKLRHLAQEMFLSCVTNEARVIAHNVNEGEE